MRKILFVLFLAVSTTLLAQPVQQKYSRVKVFLHETHISELAELGFEYDHGVVAKGKYWINDISAREIEILKENKLSFEVLIDDVQAWYVEQNKLPFEENSTSRNNNICGDSDLTTQYETPANYTFGSMGGYHTYTQLLTVLDDMKAKFPNLISEKQPIGEYLTQEGRPIYWLKIGNNPNIDEDKPAILYNSLHHAREPNSLSQMMFYMWYLLENYEKDEEVKFIVDNVEMYFIPCVNPDGYVYNERISPNGGGHWRKNRWVNAMGDTVGVDLNRNYGFHWGLDNAGSSPDQLNEVYRGIAPFSEPETKALRDFCVQHQFKIALNYHSFSNLLIIPWGFDNSLTPDDASYRALGKKMTEQNNYFIGTGLETVGYLVNGDSDDWMYGEQETKPKILSMTPEVGPGTFGFWPPANAIDRLNKDNLWQNLSAAALLKPYGEVIDLNPNILDKSEGTLSFELQNIGLEGGGFTVIVQPRSDNLMINSEPLGISLAHLEKSNFSIDYTILDAENIEQTIDFEIILNHGAFDRKIKFSKKFFAKPFEFLFTDMVGTNLTHWTATETWGTTTQTFFSEENSITDSPNGNYKDRSSSFVQTKEVIDLAGAVTALVKFRGKWALENSFDYVQFLISTDLPDFTPLCGNYSVTNGRNQPAYNGFQNEWILEEIDISEYIGQKVYFRFQLDSDDFVNEDGFYFDDFEVEIIREGATTAIAEPAFIQKNTLQITPNPFAENFVVDFVLTEKVGELTLRLTNTLGQEVATKQLENLGTGAHQFSWESLNLENGVYFLQLQTVDKQIITKSILKIE